MYTGRELFKGESLDDILESHQLETTPALTEYVPDCPQSFNYVIRKMISKNPADRYQTANEALADMQACFDGATGIKDLPSISQLKQLADSSTSIPAMKVDLQRSKLPLTLTIAALFIIGSILGIFLMKESKKPETVTSPDNLEKEVIVEEEKSQQLVSERQEDPEVDKVNSTPKAFDESLEFIQSVPEKTPKVVEAPTPAPETNPPVPKEKTFKFTAVRYADDRMKLIEVSPDLQSCVFEFNDWTVKRTLTYKLNEVGTFFKVIKITPKYVICDTGKKAYKRELNKVRKVADMWILNDSEGKEYNFTYFHQKIHGYSFTGYENDTITIRRKNQQITLSPSFTHNNNYLHPLSDKERKAILAESSPNNKITKRPIIFARLEHVYMPFKVIKTAPEAIMVEDLESKKSVHKINDILIKRLQLRSIKDDLISFRDITTSKTYKLIKGEKFKLKTHVFINVSGELHKVQLGQEFMGFTLVEENGKYFLKSKKAEKVLLKKGQAVFSKNLNSHSGSHRLVDCPCYEEEVDVNENITSVTNVLDIKTQWLMDNCLLEVRKIKAEGNSRRYIRLGYLKWNGSEFEQKDNYNKIKAEDLLYFSNKLFINRLEMKNKFSSYPLQNMIDDTEGYAVKFLPANFKAIVELLHYAKVNYITKGMPHEYTFATNTLKVFKKDPNDSSKTISEESSFTYSLNESEESITINDEKFFLRFRFGDVLFINSRLYGAKQHPSLSLDNYKLSGDIVTD